MFPLERKYSSAKRENSNYCRLDLQEYHSQRSKFKHENDENSNTNRYGNVSMSQRANLFDNLDTLAGHTLTDSKDPVFGESIGCQYGLILHTHEFEDSYKSLSLDGVKDRAQVFVNGAYQGLSYRVSPSDVTLKSSVSQGDVLQILVENMGRINFSPGGMKDTRKGLTVTSLRTVRPYFRIGTSHAFRSTITRLLTK